MIEFIKNNLFFKIFKRKSLKETETQRNGFNGGNDTRDDNKESVCCRICNIKDDNQLLYNPCSCVGQSSFIHRKCLDVWFEKARYDVLCCECKARYVRIKYRQNSSFFIWLKEEPKVKRHVIIGAIVFPLLFAIVGFGTTKAYMANTGDIYKVLFVPTMAFGVLTLWKFVGSLALILRAYRDWKFNKLNTKCDYKHKTDKK